MITFECDELLLVFSSTMSYVVINENGSDKLFTYVPVWLPHKQMH